MIILLSKKESGLIKISVIYLDFGINRDYRGVN